MKKSESYPAHMPDFKDAASLKESSSMLYAAAVILRVALGEVCSVNSRVGSPVFDQKAAESLVPSFDKVFDYIHKSYDAFNSRSAALLEAGGEQKPNS